ncbi:MAG TPA: DUF1579 domain-containing protein [Verrucomicrobiae bacterium]
MKNTYSLNGSTLGCAVGIAVGLFVCTLQAGDKKEAPGAGTPDMESMMKKMEELAAPGPEHRLLASMAGQWEAEARCYMAGPEAQPTVTKGTCKSTMILGGRFLQEEFQGDMMGKKFTGMGIMGYDKFNKKYVNIWLDDMGTGVFTSEGTSDESGKVLTLNGKMDEPMTGEKAKPVRLVVRSLSPDKRVFEMHDLALGEKSKVMEIIYTRASGSFAGRQ